jgi:Tfx family DNA-binding protein
MTEDVPDANEILERTGFDPETTVLTRRQAEVLALRERGLSQASIADRLATSRANISSVESSARENIRKARETIGFGEILQSAVHVTVSVDTDLYDVPEMIYSACDEADINVQHTEPELLNVVSDGAGDAVRGRQVLSDLLIGVTSDGAVRVREQ